MPATDDVRRFISTANSVTGHYHPHVLYVATYNCQTVLRGAFTEVRIPPANDRKRRPAIFIEVRAMRADGTLHEAFEALRHAYQRVREAIAGDILSRQASTVFYT